MPEAPIAAGIIYVAPDGDILLLRRSDSERTWPSHWNLPGGRAEPGEAPDAAAEREAVEEIGISPGGPKRPFDVRATPNGMVFHSFVKPVEEPFSPLLNNEHSAFMWSGLHQLPEPMHPALRKLLAERLGERPSKEERLAFAAWCREEVDGRARDSFSEADHPRDEDGKFISKGGSPLRLNEKPAHLGELTKTFAGKSNVFVTEVDGQPIVAKTSNNDAGEKVELGVSVAAGEVGARNVLRQRAGRAVIKDKEVDVVFSPKLDGKAISEIEDYFDKYAAVVESGSVEDKTEQAAFDLLVNAADRSLSNYIHDGNRLVGIDYELSFLDKHASVDGNQYFRMAFSTSGQEVMPGKFLWNYDPAIELDRSALSKVASETESVARIAKEVRGARAAAVVLERGAALRKLLENERITAGEFWELSQDLAGKAPTDMYLEKARALDAKARDSVAFDRATVRRYDQDGHLRVEMTNISKANICPYYGREIPDFEALGLDPDRIYRLYRDPAELERGATTFAGKPLLLVHTPVSADDHPRNLTIGAVGDDVCFEPPYLQAPLTVWDGSAIELIETNQQKELSSSYRYRADMTAGEVNGEAYDGVMRDIVGNHVALVREGRAGPDVVVGDSALNAGLAEPVDKVGDSKMEITMNKTTKLSRMAGVAHGALIAFLQPRLAMDAKVDLSPALAGVTGKNFKAKHADIVGAVTKATAGKLAKDAKLDGLDKLLVALDESCDPQEAMDEEEETDKAEDEEEEAKKAEDEEAEKKAAEEKAAADRKARDNEPEEEKVDKKAMDAAIKAAADEAVARTKREMLQAQRDIREAEEAVRPYIGKLAMAHDSADSIYRTALGILGVANADKLHPDALKPVLQAQPLPGVQPRSATVAMDAAKVGAFHTRFPGAKSHPVRVL